MAARMQVWCPCVCVRAVVPCCAWLCARMHLRAGACVLVRGAHVCVRKCCARACARKEHARRDMHAPCLSSQAIRAR
eukprot:3513681-Alexandrium_andersonii.AAC.1